MIEGGTQLSDVDQEKLPIQDEVQEVVQPPNPDERNSLTKKSEPEDTTPHSDIKQETFPEHSYDTRPSEGDREGLPIKEQQPRKINEAPGDVCPPVLTQGTEKQPRRKDDVQPLDVAQQRPSPMKDDVQLSGAIHHEEPEATIQSPDGKQETSETKEKTPDVGGIQRSNIVPENLPDVMYEQQPRKIDKPLDDNEEKLPLVGAQDGGQLSEVVHHEEPEPTIQSPDGKQEISETKEKTPDVGGIQRSNIVPENIPDVVHEQQPRKINKPLDDNEEKLPLVGAQDGGQLSEVIHHDEPEPTIQSPDGKQEISETKEKTPDVGDIQRSNIVPGNLPGVMYEQQPRKIDKPLDDDQGKTPPVGAQGDIQEIVDIHQEEPESPILSQDGNQETSGTARKTPEVAENFQPSDLSWERSPIDEQHQNGCPPDIMREREPRKQSDEVPDHVQPAEDSQPRKRKSRDLGGVQSPDVNQATGRRLGWRVRSPSPG